MIGCYAGDLKTALADLLDGDFLEKNRVGNLTIYRKNINIGIIDLLGGSIVFWNDGEE